MLNRGGVTNSTLFSLKFGNDPYIGTNGKLYIGKHEDFSKNNVATCPIVNSTNNIYWICEVSSFGMKNSGNEIKTNRKFNFIFDTGTNAILLPLEFKNDFQNNIQKLDCLFVEIQDQSAFQLVCENLNNVPDLILGINGYNLILSKRYIFYQINQTFYSNFIFTKKGLAIIGSPFFLLFILCLIKKVKDYIFIQKMMSI